MTLGLRGLGVADNWTIEIDDVDGDAASSYGVTFLHPNLRLQFNFEDLDLLRGLARFLQSADSGADYEEYRPIRMASANLRIARVDAGIRFQLVMLSAPEAERPELLEVTLDEAESLAFLAALVSALEDAAD